MIPSRTRVIAACIAALLALIASLPQALAQPTVEPPKPLRIGVGGDYPEGVDGVLMSRGLPHERIFPWELADREVLKKYDVLLLSCPNPTRGALDPALTEWITAGGRAYVEAWPGLQGPWPLQQLVVAAGVAPEQSDVHLATTDHPVTKGFDPGKPISLYHLTGTFIRARQPEQAVVLGQYCRRDDGSIMAWRGAAALLCLKIGQGKVVYSGAPLSFLCFHRGPSSEPITNAIINYLAGRRAISRLTTAVAEPSSATPQPAASPAPAKPAEEGALPSGFQLIDQPTDGGYDITARVSKAATGGTRASVLLLDGQFDAKGKATRPCLWLAMGGDRIELRAGKAPNSANGAANGAAIASARWQLPGRPSGQPSAQPDDLLIQRRPGTVTVALGDKELLRAKTGIVPGGMVAFAGGCVALAEPLCQPVGDPVFADDFMRERGDQAPWTPLGGDWRIVGVGNEGQSVNGFYYRGSAAGTALTGVGEPWWEEYAVSAAVRLDDTGTAGVCALRRAGSDYVAFLADSTQKTGAGLRLVQARGGTETVLAQRPGGIAPGQWYRLTVRLQAGKLEALLDGEPVLQCPHRELRGGGIALLVRGGGARFDDVLVQPFSQPLRAPRNEGSPAPDVPTTLGPQDHLTWANPAAPWTACAERPSLLWHAGDFPGDLEASLPILAASEPVLRRLILAPSPTSPEPEWLSATVRVLPGAKQAAVGFARPGEKPQESQVDLGVGGTLQLTRRGEALTVLWNETVIFKDRGTGGMRCIGLEIEGPPVQAQSILVRAPEVRDYVFGVAPTDWWTSAGTWEIASRWACDNRWSWYAGWGNGDLAMWNKRPVEGDVVMDYYMGVKMEAPGGPETSRCRDLNAVICGDKSDPRSGYSLILGGDGDLKTQLLRKGVVVAERADIRVPGGYGIHHEWFRLRFARIGHRIEVDFDGRPVFRYDDPQPLPGGFVGLWSRDSGVLIPRVTVYR